MSYVYTQKGLSLIELMIAMMLGLIISGAALQLFIDSRLAFNVVNSEARMQDSGRFASEFTGRYLRMAGYRAFSSKTRKPNLPADDTFQTNQGIFGTDNGADASVSDSFSVRVGAGSGTDCEGTIVDNSNAPVTMTFSVINGVLTCTSSTDPNDPVPLVDNIQNMQVQYGFDTDGSPDLRPNRYQLASQLTGSDWLRVTTARIAFLIRAPGATAPGLNQNYSVLGVNVAGNDGHLRQVFESSYALKNLMRVM